MPASLADSGSLLVIIAIICLTIGYVFGWLISSMQRGKEEKREVEVVDDAPAEKPAEAPAVVAEAPSILRVRQGETAEDLVVQIGDKTFGAAGSLSVDDRTQIENALRRTADWMGLAYQLGEPAPAAAAAVVSPVVEGVVAVPDASQTPPRQASVIAGMTNALADALQPTVKKEAPLSIVQQIDEIFQGMLTGTEYEGKKVYLAEDPKKGVIVRVENDTYEGVNAVPEGKIKTLLRTAVTEWERRQELNRRRLQA